jgi:hypothetical protein
MALNNYSDLIAAVPNWSARADLTSRIPEFISLAESDFNRELRTNQMLVNAPNFVIAGEFVNQPSGFLEVKDWFLNVSPRSELCFLSDELATNYYSSSGKPKYYSISGTQFRINPAPDGTYSTTLRYYQAIPGLQANSTNWLMTAHPNLYLFACMLQTTLFTQDDVGVQKWAQAYQQELQSVKGADQKSRYGGSGMAVRNSSTVY